MNTRPYGPAASMLTVLVVSACDRGSPIDPPDPTDLESLSVAIDAPDTIAANDSFDVVVRLHNDEQAATTGFTARLAYGHGFDAPDLMLYSLDEHHVAHVGGNDSLHATFRVAVDETTVGMGGEADIAVCVIDESDDDIVFCERRAVQARPDIVALCAPSMLELPATGTIAQHECAVRNERIGVFAVDAAAGHSFTIDIAGASGYDMELFDQRGMPIEAIGSRPDGKWFLVPVAGTYHVVFRCLAANEDWSFVIEDAGPFPALRSLD